MSFRRTCLSTEVHLTQERFAFREGPPYNPLNVLYNLADLINKGAFGLAIWSAAISDTEREPLLG
jgi:hypothetical protein